MPRRSLDYALRAYFNGRTIGARAVSVPYAVRAVRRIMEDESVPKSVIEEGVRAFATERQIPLSDTDQLPPPSPVPMHRMTRG